jgi:tetratricopeptide (TPR) repeat protein
LEAAARAAPEGETRWKCLCILADALNHGNRLDQSLEYYRQAADLARISTEAGGDTSRQAWPGLATILRNWSTALLQTANLAAAREKLVEASETNLQAGVPLVEVIDNELQALRIDVMQGHAEAALPQIEERLRKIERWWTANRAGLPTPDAPDLAHLARAMMSALDIAGQANHALRQWEAALKRIKAVIKIKQELRLPPEDIARERINLANMLCALNRHSEAKLELEACLDIFIFENDPVGRAKVLSSLAKLYDDIGDLAQAIAQQRRALTLANALPPDDRAISHQNLAIYLRKASGQQNLAESARHRLAVFVYFLVSGRGQYLKAIFRGYVILFRIAASAGTEPNIPRLTELLADPAFAALKEWLTQRQVDLDDLQAAIDQILDQALQAAKQSPAQ